MAPERWQQIEKLLQAALESAPSERSAFLDEACAGDQALRNEVESLIPLREQTIGQLETSSLEMAADLPGDRPNESGLGGSRLAPSPTASDQQGPLSPEKVVQDPAIVDGKYLLECRLGQGGMGSVYRARHIELGK